MPPNGHGFWPIKFILATFVNGHPVNIPGKLLSIMDISYRR